MKNASSRDPAFIEPIANEIRRIKAERPALRLGQILLNSCLAGQELYYVEDAELLELLRRY